jgi:hypothetical protein
MARTTLHKEGKVSTSSMEASMAQALVAQPGSKALDDNLADYDPNLLSFNAVESDIIYRTSSRLQKSWPNSWNSDCPV